MKHSLRQTSGSTRSRRTLTVLVASFALAVSATPALAQQGQGGRQMLDADERLAALTERLDLSDEQVKELKPIVEEQTKKQEELFQNAGGDRETLRADMMKLLDETEGAYAEVLTEEQMNQYREMMQRRMRQARPPGSGR
jgi:hypothetical protein